MAETPTQAPAKDKQKQDADLLRQLEYYLSDASLPFDDFLTTEMKREPPAEAAGDSPLVSIAAATLASFPRVVMMTPGLTDEQRADELRAAAARSDVLCVCADGRIGRRYPLPADDAAADRSVFLGGLARGLGEERLRALIASLPAMPAAAAPGGAAEGVPAAETEAAGQLVGSGADPPRGHRPVVHPGLLGGMTSHCAVRSGAPAG
jgi:hypothetical protein